MTASPELWEDILFHLNGACRELKAQALAILHNFLSMSKLEHSLAFLHSNYQVLPSEQFIVVVVSCLEDKEDVEVCRQSLAVLEVMLQLGTEWAEENRGYVLMSRLNPVKEEILKSPSLSHLEDLQNSANTELVQQATNFIKKHFQIQTHE